MANMSRTAVWLACGGAFCVIAVVAPLSSAASALSSDSAEATAVPNGGVRSALNSKDICKGLKLLGAGEYAKVLVETLSGKRVARGNKLLDLAVGTALTHCDYLLGKARAVARVGLGYIFGPQVQRPSPDVSPPFAVPPGVAIRNNYTVGTGGVVRAVVYWGGFDLQSGVAGYTLMSRFSRGGGRWSNWATAGTAGSGTVASREDFDLSRGFTFQFAVRARDRRGNASTWAIGNPFSLNVFREDQTALGGRWFASTGPAAVDGRTYYSTRPGAWVRLTFTGSYVAWIAPKWSGGGLADVYVDGQMLQRVNLSRQATAPREVVSAWIWPSSARHVIEVRVVSGRIDVDAFTVLT
jgi:hypothetical protein